MKRHVLPLLLAALLACTTALPTTTSAPTVTLAAPVPTATPVVTRQAMVVSAHPEASRIGTEVLRRGGNAYDAAVAVQFALAVALPAAGNIGGGGFLLYRAADGQEGALDFRETAPAAATRDMYLDAQSNVVPDRSTLGHLAVGVPGTVAGMVELHRKQGKLPWRDVVQPAVDLAAQGLVLTSKEAAGLNAQAKAFRHLNAAHHPAYVKAQGEWQTGERIVYPELAATLGRIRDQGRAGFYDGQTAELLVAEMQHGRGLITKKDLQNYQPKWRTPLHGQYRGHEVLTFPPPSSGGVALLQMLQMLEPYNLKAAGWHSPQATHWITEAQRRVYADRATYLGDPDFGRVPVAQLLEKSYNKQRMASTLPYRATPSSQVAAGAGLPGYESDQTTHYSIVDAQGNAVSCTTTLNGAYGSKVVVAGAGFLLNNEMDDFSSKPGTPNAYGLVGGTANAIQPGKRMLSSMTPTILTKNGKLTLVTGTPGGSTIITSVLQSILHVLDYDMNAQQAVAAPRLHHQWLPDQIDVEVGALLPTAQDTLRARGYRLNPRAAWGRVDIIRVLPNGQLEGGADPRGDDSAQGY
ncbi:gamma-glutamyltransferase [Hymenobacter sp. J193]|uniref:gamma-glutamyltransferase n=1 Tax=Hymenobacter sp. J193 TaxID=2898429 RepID=UPI002151450F|nr:gamma-glutamyltransferase [Hymenobacter sp. J193]MCR5889063.1 gamma-glutamyltransferase [Hymenobacter sp. J193]